MFASHIKFGRIPLTTPKKCVKWKPRPDIKYPAQKKNPATWEIFTQSKIVIPPNTSKIILIPFGFELSDGMVIISLKQELKSKKATIHNETILENVESIIISIQNNSSNTLNIDENVPFCFVHHQSH